MKSRADGSKVWELRFYETDDQGKRQRRTATIGTFAEFASQSAARKSPVLQAILMCANDEHPKGRVEVPTVGSVIGKFLEVEFPDLRYNTQSAYRSLLKMHITPRWGSVRLDAVKPLDVEQWLKGLPLAPKSKLHIRNLMRLLFHSAQRWEMTSTNPISIVRVKGGTKRQKQIKVLTPDEFCRMLTHLKEPYRTMALVAGVLGLRVSELVGLQWRDFDFDRLTVAVTRSAAHGRVDDVKTECSRNAMPLDAELARSIQQYRKNAYPTSEGWLFASPRTGKPYHQEQIQKNHLLPAAEAAGIEGMGGWHTFRHSYRSWLDDTGASMSVQKELMRHADISTTMNVYGKAMADSKRQAHSRIVERVLPTMEASSATQR